MIEDARPFDLGIIGAGSAGLVAASFARAAGARVVLVEASRIGGDCTWTGCVPSKALLHAGKVARQVKNAAGFGVLARFDGVDFPRVMAHVHGARERVYARETPERLREQGIQVALGHGRFLDPRTIEVDGKRIRARHFVICTGAAPIIPRIPGLAATPYVTYETAFDLPRLPRRLLVLGGGSVGVEMAQAFARLGSQVTLIEQVDRLLPAVDPEASRAIDRQLRAEGVAVRVGRAVERVESGGEAVALEAGGERLEGDLLLVAAGRRPRLDGLELERAGVAFDAGGIKVDVHLRTSQPHIYAAGDAVAGSPQFTHYAGWQGFVAARNALLPGKARGIRAGVPSVVFTDPEIGQVGISEDEARRQGEPLRVYRVPVSHIDRAQTAAEDNGFAKIVARPNGRLLGATVVSTSAGELIDELSLALDGGLRLPRLAATLHAYPTYGMAIQELALRASLVRATSGWRGRLLRALIRRG